MDRHALSFFPIFLPNPSDSVALPVSLNVHRCTRQPQMYLRHSTPLGQGPGLGFQPHPPPWPLGTAGHPSPRGTPPPTPRGCRSRLCFKHPLPPCVAVHAPSPASPAPTVWTPSEAGGYSRVSRAHCHSLAARPPPRLLTDSSTWLFKLFNQHLLS